ncbi:GyrI-like domain-containing protein [Paenibacillus ginsengarvi]|uniref:AraC family transcriptional regulator n=1 Tax=Paenibacillus ginsengarvi TaxID=400777 RepID=A0A3B0CCE3_9BACL|nr:GyrI-like domain-containing protein [Paenibacillus ginsengarvi]RKN82194.1 AraC family transcriptional regulator [Paenibacillus ginsengarvi]
MHQVDVHIEDYMQIHFEKKEAILVIGLKVGILRDKSILFKELEIRGNEIENKKNQNQYLITSTLGLVAAYEVTKSASIPVGMISYIIPADKYAVCRFEEKYKNSFLEQISKDPIKSKYNLSFNKPRFEILINGLQSQGITEIYIPTS